MAVNTTITPEMIASGLVYVEVFAMKRDSQGTRVVQNEETPDHYDVVIRPDDWAVNEFEPFEEWESLTLAERDARIASIQDSYPDIVINYVE